SVRVAFTKRVWQPNNPTLAEAFGHADPHDASRALVVLDAQLAQSQPDIAPQIRQCFDQGDLPLLADVLYLPGGEASKNDPAHLDTLYRAMLEHDIDRRSYVLAIGGGALLDAVGYAAATLHRGVRLIRCPTTTLAQCDSGVGVKNAVNRFGIKNAVGTFAIPWAVINDSAALASLPDDTWRHGFAEVVKVALLKDAALFHWLESHADALAARDEALAHHAWQRSAQLHLHHIAASREAGGGGDPFEQRHARPLDLGHWAAHRLEELSRHTPERTIPHGPAVSLGLTVDLTYASRLGLLAPGLADRVISLLETLGLPTRHPLLAHPQLPEGLEAFRQHLGGRLTITTIRGIADPIDLHKINEQTLDSTLQSLASLPDTVSA
ncbi:MAG: 3-dehydroquinate synthase, partial [Planctomycetota bacterium]